MEQRLAIESERFNITIERYIPHALNVAEWHVPCHPAALKHIVGRYTQVRRRGAVEGQGVRAEGSRRQVVPEGEGAQPRR